MGIIRAKQSIIGGPIPDEIARDAEVMAALNAHTAAVDPHPVYLSQSEGDGRYRQSAVALVDADIPAAIARDSETTAALNTHTAAADPHPSLWTRIVNAFLALTGGQAIIKNNPEPSVVSYAASQNHLELRTSNGSNPILGFHRAGFSATALYHAGYGNESLRIRNADGYDSELLHKVNHLDVPGFHSVRCTLFSRTVPAVGVSITIPHAPIPAAKIVGITFYILEGFVPGGTFYIVRSANEDLNSRNEITVTNGNITIPGTTANYFVGCPIHFLVSHIP